MAYIHRADVTRHQPPKPPMKEVTVFGQTVKVYDDNWRNHLHVIPTYKCNAECAFCIEQHSKCLETSLFVPYYDVIHELRRAGILHTVSFTGGEPSLYQGLEALMRITPKRDVFKTINTNGTKLFDLCKMGFDWINVSRHHIDERMNEAVFNCQVPSLQYIKEARAATTSKIRLQAVVNENTRLRDYLELIDMGICDDVSFRSIMLDGSKSSQYYHELYQKLIEDALAMDSKVIEQEIQDYYIYEMHQIGRRFVTFSYSNMEYALKDDEEDSSLIREFILRPDGSLSGSWKEGVKMIRI